MSITRLILREHQIFPATKEAYRVHLGTGNLIKTKSTIDLVYFGQYAEIGELKFNGTSSG